MAAISEKLGGFFLSKRPKDRYYYVDDYSDYEDRFLEKRSRKPKPKRASANLVYGVVIRARGHHFDVQTTDEFGQEGDDRVRVCEVRGRLLQDKGKDTLVAVGDRVWVRPNGPDKGLIERIEERLSVLSRQRPGVDEPAEDVILANPDQALVVFAAAQPEPHLRMLDRFLVIAEANSLRAIICVNKIDLTGRARAREIFGLYEKIGYRTLYTSAKTGEGIGELGALLADSITVVTGPSGSGKSHLLNALHPDLHLQTGDLRDFMNKGRHTTRSAQLFALPFGANTFVADTPGIRELGLYEIEPADLGFYFKEIAPYVHECHYPNCTHDHEPECAVRAALGVGKIHPDRYDSYLRLLHKEE
jgi:ribosome biogenesis GTPase